MTNKIQNFTNEQLFEAWKYEQNNAELLAEMNHRRKNASGRKCRFCGGTESWTGLITSCGCIDWDD